MPSPFPGMDPYLEGHLWPDVHATLIVGIRAAIAAKLPPGYFANIDQYLWLGESDDEDAPLTKRTRRGKPDTFVTNGAHAASNGAGVGTTLVAAEPTVRVRLPNPKGAKRKKYIRLIDTGNNDVVTVIELLSPSDKLPKADRARYLAKRAEYLGARVNLVEIDLLRKGQRVPMGTPDPPEADYYVLVSRAAEYPEAGVWAFTVRDPIPVFPVPLKDEDAAVALDLRACLDAAYDAARYAGRIDYAGPCEPALRKPDAEWVAGRFRNNGA